MRGAWDVRLVRFFSFFLRRGADDEGTEERLEIEQGKKMMLCGPCKNEHRATASCGVLVGYLLFPPLEEANISFVL